jgi:hypothetical protein
MRWPYILQQIVVLGAWCWVVRVIWSEVRGLMEEVEEANRYAEEFLGYRPSEEALQVACPEIFGEE